MQHKWTRLLLIGIAMISLTLSACGGNGGGDYDGDGQNTVEILSLDFYFYVSPENPNQISQPPFPETMTVTTGMSYPLLASIEWQDSTMSGRTSVVLSGVCQDEGFCGAFSPGDTSVGFLSSGYTISLNDTSSSHLVSNAVGSLGSNIISLVIASEIIPNQGEVTLTLATSDGRVVTKELLFQ